MYQESGIRIVNMSYFAGGEEAVWRGERHRGVVYQHRQWVLPDCLICSNLWRVRWESGAHVSWCNGQIPASQSVCAKDIVCWSWVLSCTRTNRSGGLVPALGGRRYGGAPGHIPLDPSVWCSHSHGQPFQVCGVQVCPSRRRACLQPHGFGAAHQGCQSEGPGNFEISPRSRNCKTLRI